MVTGDEKTREIIQKVKKDVLDHPEIQNTHKYYEMDRKEAQEMWMKKLFYMSKHLDKSFYFTPW